MAIKGFDHRVRLHSKTHTEGQNTYYFGHDGKDIHGTIETYLFLPRSIGINPKTYSRDQFYQDLKSAYLLKLAPTSLSGLAGSLSPSIRLLNEAADRLALERDDAALRELDVRHRLFGRLVSETVASFLHQARGEKHSSEQRKTVEYFLQHAPALCRRLREIYRADLADIEGYRSAYHCNDEHLSLLMEQAAYQLAERVNRKLPPGESCEEAQRLMAFARAESAYRETQKYPSLASSKRNFENLVSRISMLENHMTSVLYLSARNQPDGAVSRELLMSLAAGIAMIFATAVAFLAHVQYENWTSTFFVILVISYMFKDRIKAQAQTYLAHKSKRFFYDFRTRVYGLTRRNAIGYKRETFGFVKPEQLDDEIRRSRSRDEHDYARLEARDELVICYKRVNHFDHSRITSSYAGFGVDGITNVSGFDLTRMTQKMEDSKRTVYLPLGNRASKVQGRRVYRLYVVTRASLDGQSAIARHCLVLNRSGIKRLLN